MRSWPPRQAAHYLQDRMLGSDSASGWTTAGVLYGTNSRAHVPVLTGPGCAWQRQGQGCDK